MGDSERRPGESKIGSTILTTVIGIIITAILSTTISVAVSQSKDTEHDRRLGNLEQDGKNDHDLIVETRNDVKWLRERFSQKP